VTSTTAYRYWDWKPSNDRDFIGLPVTSISAAPSYQTQWTQEVRYAGGVAAAELRAGVFAFSRSSIRIRRSSRSRARARRVPAGADAAARRRACSTATASTSSCSTTT
jgi:iron complex outermembrane receptor protein